MKSYLKTSLYFLLFCMMISLIFADTFSVQGVLRDPLGKTVSDGTYAMTFRLYDQETGGTPLWEETQGSIPVLHGVYNAELGTVTSLAPLPFNTTYWLGLSIEGGVELEPRYKLLKSPAAMSVLGTENVFPSVGNIGVGTTAPGAALHIVADPSDPKLLIEQTTGEDMIIVDPAGNMGVRVSIPEEALDIDGNLKMRNGGAILFDDGSSLNSAYFGGTSSSVSNNFDLLITSDVDNNNSGDILFNVGSNTKMILDNSGKVGIGIGNTAPNAQLQVNGSLVANSIWIGTTSGYPLEVLSDQLRSGWFLNSSSQTGAAAIYANSGGDYAGYFEGNLHYTGTLTGPSDIKFKTNVHPLESVLDQLKQVKVHTFDFKHTGEAGKMNLPRGPQFGFIAQEFAEVFPELVKDEVNVYNKNQNMEDTAPEMVKIHYKGVNQIGMIPILTAAVQEQQAEIEAQNALINDLLQRIEALENR